MEGNKKLHIQILISSVGKKKFILCFADFLQEEKNPKILTKESSRSDL